MGKLQEYAPKYSGSFTDFKRITRVYDVRVVQGNQRCRVTLHCIILLILINGERISYSRDVDSKLNTYILR
jgi:hypothetical protein